MSFYPSVPGMPASPAMPADPLSRGPGMMSLPGEDDLRARILAMLTAKGGLAERTGALHPVFQNPVGGMPLSGGQVFLRSLVSGYNGQAEPDVKQAKALSALLSLDQTNAYRQGTLANQQVRTGLTADNQNPDVKGSSAWGKVQGVDQRQQTIDGLQNYRDWLTENGDKKTAAMVDNVRSEIIARRAATAQAATNEAGRNTRHATPSGTSIANGGTGGKGPSPYTADNAYYRNLGEQMIAADKAKTGGQNEQGIRSWMNAQLRDLGTVEGNRRRARQGAPAADATPAPVQPVGPKPSENPKLSPEARAFYKSQGM